MALEIETGSEDLLATLHDHVLVLTLNRPERLNAFSEGMTEGLAAGVIHAATDPQVRVVMVTGAGRAFCAGGDVKGMNERNRTANEEPSAAPSHFSKVDHLRRRQNDSVLAMHRLPKPVIAAIPGACAGAGMSVSLAADLRIGSPDAFFLTAFSNVAASGDFGGSWSLTQIVGTAKARELFFRNERVHSEEAARIGLLNAVLHSEDFQGAALQYCHQIAEKPPLALTRMKENLNRALRSSFAESLDAEAENMVLTMSTADHHEAAAAFVEKRAPTFHGA